jgi:hypothetical protein
MSTQRGRDVETLAAAKIYSNVETQGVISEYAVTTDCGHMLQMREDGNKANYVPKSSAEYVGKSCKEKEIAKLIYAENGDIYLDAPAGDIVIRAKNIRLEAQDGSGEITIRSGKIVELNGPVVRTKGTDVTVTATKSVDIIGTTVDSSASVQVSSSSLSDVTQGSAVGSILSALGKLKQFISFIS